MGNYLGQIGMRNDYWKNKKMFREKVEREKQELLSEKEKAKMPPPALDPELIDKNKRIYRDGDGNVIPAFKTGEDGNVIEGNVDDALDLEPFWKRNQSEEDSSAGEINDPKRKEADAYLNAFYGSIDSEVNKKSIPVTSEKETLEDNDWKVFGGGSENFDGLMNQVRQRGLYNDDTETFLSYLNTSECQRIMEENEIFIHVNSATVLHDYFDTDKNLYEFLTLQSDTTKKYIRTLLKFQGTYKFFVEDYLTSIDAEDQSLLDISSNNFSKFLAANYNCGYQILRGGGNPIYFRYSRATEDDVMLES